MRWCARAQQRVQRRPQFAVVDQLALEQRLAASLQTAGLQAFDGQLQQFGVDARPTQVQMQTGEVKAKLLVTRNVVGQ